MSTAMNLVRNDLRLRFRHPRAFLHMIVFGCPQSPSTHIAHCLRDESEIGSLILLVLPLSVFSRFINSFQFYGKRWRKKPELDNMEAK